MSPRARRTERVLDDATSTAPTAPSGIPPALTYGQMGSEELPPLVLLHGLGARWQVFSPLMLRMSDVACGWAVDFRGHGGSGRTPGRYRLADFAADAARFITTVCRPPVSVYGHSLGGWVGLHLAAERPDLVRELIVADSAIHPTDLDPALVVSYLADLPLALRSLAVSLDQLDPEVMEHFRDGRMLAEYDPDELLPAVGCRTLLLQADPGNEGLMSDRDVEQALALLPDAHHEQLLGIGHALHVEDGDRVADILRTFLTA